MKGFEDLYGDAIIEVIELNVNPTFDVIKSYFTDLDSMERTFSFKGKKIIAKRKFTYSGGNGKMFTVKTNYLHVWIQSGLSENTMIHYKENKQGNFKTI